MGVMYSEIVAAIKQGNATFESLQETLLVGTGCSSCHEEIKQIIKEAGWRSSFLAYHAKHSSHCYRHQDAMQKSSILCLIFLATIAFQIFSYPVSYRHLVRDERHIHLIGDFHVPLTGTTRSEAVLLQRINERAEQKPITVIWEYNQCSPQLKSIREKLYAIEGRSAGFVFVQDAPETLSKKLNFGFGGNACIESRMRCISVSSRPPK